MKDFDDIKMHGTTIKKNKEIETSVGFTIVGLPDKYRNRNDVRFEGCLYRTHL
jgi:hypothetical protein